MRPEDRSSLWSVVQAAGGASAQHIWGPDAAVDVRDLGAATSLAGSAPGAVPRALGPDPHPRPGLRRAGPAGAGRRWPAGWCFARSTCLEEHLPFVAATAEVDAVVADSDAAGAAAFAQLPVIACSPRLTPLHEDRRADQRSEWILLTSGTTGAPKLVVHDLTTFAGAIAGFSAGADSLAWSTFYDMRRYGGLILFVRAIASGGSIVLTSAAEPVASFLGRVAAHGVSHLTGSPSTWRRALMSPAVAQISPQHIRLSGEVVDQAILDRLREAFPDAQITHAFAATETGLAFEVSDGLAGFPESTSSATTATSVSRSWRVLSA